VQVVTKPNGRRYYYWAPGRNTSRAEKPVPLGSDATDPTFWAKLQKLQGRAVEEAGTFNALIREYRASAAWSHLRPRSRDDYGKYLARIEGAAGDRLVDALCKSDIYRWRDQLSVTPVLANHLLSILRTLRQAEIAEIDSWQVGPLDLYLKSVTNRPYTQPTMNRRWNLWKARQSALAGLGMTIHGLRATAVCDRRLAGSTHQEISAELCMSMGMVMRYSRWMDQEMSARASRDRREENVARIGG
jgi:hypothetical protein